MERRNVCLARMPRRRCWGLDSGLVRWWGAGMASDVAGGPGTEKAHEKSKAKRVLAVVAVVLLLILAGVVLAVVIALLLPVIKMSTTI